MGCSSVRYVCKEKQPRLLSSKKGANSFSGRPSEDRTEAGAGRTLVKTDNLNSFIFSNEPHWNVQGCGRNQENEFNFGKKEKLLRIEIISSGDNFSNRIPLIPSKIDPEAKSLRILHGPLHC